MGLNLLEPAFVQTVSSEKCQNIPRAKLTFNKDDFKKMSPKTRVAFLKSLKMTLESETYLLSKLAKGENRTFRDESEELLHRYIDIKRFLFLKKNDLSEKLENVKVVVAMKDWLFKQKNEKVQVLAGLMNDSLLQHVDYNAENQTFRLFSNPLLFKSYQKVNRVASN